MLNNFKIAVWIVLLVAAGQGTVGEVQINENGYEGLKLAIHSSVKENLDLLAVLKEIFRKSSKFLYDATKRRAYIKEVTIIVPSTWSSRPEYIPDASEECLKCAEIRIAPARPETGNIPYTYQPGSCGERGMFTHFTPDFILNPLSQRAQNPSKESCIQCKQKAKIFIHEWLHLRYGVYDENGRFYRSKNQTIRFGNCAQNLFGRIRSKLNGTEECKIDKFNNVDKDCVFLPDMTSGKNNKSKVSVMYLPEMDSDYMGFCGDDDDNGAGLKHNSEAPNKQNIMCNGRSVEDVIFDNDDFKFGRNPPVEITNFNPVINIKHLISNNATNSSVPFILVLDTSTSMEGRPIEHLRSTVARFIKYIAREQCPIGMVSFALNSEVVAPLTAITDQSREELVKKIPTKLFGATAIAKGIQEAIKMLDLPDGKRQQGKLILISDGEENVKPMINDIKKDIKDSGVTIYTVAFGVEASLKLEELTTLTGGKGWQFKLDNASNSLDSALNEIGLTCGGQDEELKPVINKNGAFHLEGGKRIDGSVIVDKTGAISPEVTVLFTYDFQSEKGGQAPKITLTSPSGKEYTSASKQCTLNEKDRTLRCRFPDSEEGNWTFTIENGPDPININLMVTSDIIYERGKQTDVRPLRVDSWISAGKVEYPNVPKIYAKVENNSLPVVNAKVVATLYRPNGDSIAIQLLDNGQDPDSDADDGTYTAYITKFQGNGRYALDTRVINDGNARLLQKNGAGSKANLLPDLLAEDGEAQLEFQVSDFKKVDYIIDNEPKLNYDVLPPADVFERFVTGGTFTLEKWEEGLDLIPPSQVRDLTVKVLDPTSRTVLIYWLSPGDDKNDGQASSVEIRYHEDPTFLIRSFEKAFDKYTVIEGSLQPPQPHEKHSLTLQMPAEVDLQKLHFAVRVYDEAKNAGHISNLAFTDFTPLSDPRRAEKQDWTIYFVVGGALLVITIAVIAILVYRNLRRKGYKTPNESQARKVEMSALTEKTEDIP